MVTALQLTLEDWNNSLGSNAAPRPSLESVIQHLSQFDSNETTAALKHAAACRDAGNNQDRLSLCFNDHRPIDDISREADRKNLVANAYAAISSTDQMASHLLSLAARNKDVRLSGSEIFVAILIFVFSVAFWFSVAAKAFNIQPSWIVAILAIVGLFGWISHSTNEKKATYATTCEQIIDSAAVNALRAAKQTIQAYIADLEDSHNTDIIRAREIADLHKKSAVDTAVQVGTVTKTVAAETAEITRKLIADGKRLQADSAAAQVQVIDLLADRLEQQASRPLPTLPEPKPKPKATRKPKAAPAPVDERDARIAALQEEIAKAEEIKALEAKLAALKGRS